MSEGSFVVQGKSCSFALTNLVPHLCLTVQNILVIILRAAAVAELHLLNTAYKGLSGLILSNVIMHSCAVIARLLELKDSDNFGCIKQYDGSFAVDEAA